MGNSNGSTSNFGALLMAGLEEKSQVIGTETEGVSEANGEETAPDDSPAVESDDVAVSAEVSEETVEEVPADETPDEEAVEEASADETPDEEAVEEVPADETPDEEAAEEDTEASEGSADKE